MRIPTEPFAISLALAFTLTACKGDSSTNDGGMDDAADDAADDGDSSGDGTALDPDAPKFFDHVLPIFIENCVGCHEEGGIGPFDLTDYETAAALDMIIANETQHRTMPPFNASNTGECNTFRDARWLSDEQIDTISKWVDGGSQMGDPAAPQPPRPELDVLKGNNVAEFSTPPAYLPVADESSTSGVDDYQCFLVDPNIGDAPKFLTGYEIVPGNEQVLHHIVAFQVDPNEATPLGSTNGDLMQALDDQSPDQPGWDCFGAAGNGVVPLGTPITWAPGGGAFNFPDGTGIRFDPGQVLVVQTHYNLANGIGEDQSVIRINMEDSVPREAVNAFQDKFLGTLFNGNPVTIPGGDPAFVWSWQERLADFHPAIAAWDKVELLGMLPHMHELGARMQVNIIHGPAEGADETCGIYVDRWDFNWQRAFMYEQPMILTGSETINVVCEWDASRREAATIPGLGTGSEMCLLGVYAAQAQ